MAKRLLLFLVILLLFSCNQSQTVFVSPTSVSIFPTDEISIETKTSDQIESPDQNHTANPDPSIVFDPTAEGVYSTETTVITPSPITPPDNRCDDALYTENFDEQGEFMGSIYFWSPYPYPYMSYNPNVGLISLQELNPVNDNIPGPSQGFAPSFSSDGQKIAYLATNRDGIVELWVADTNLCHIERIWEDTEHWLVDVSEYRMDFVANITWGPADNSLIIVSHVNLPHIAVYSLSSGEVYEWSGECNQVTVNENSEWTTVCTFDDGEKFNYAILDTDGSIRLYDSIVDNSINAIDWAFSPDQHHIVYLAEDYSFYLADANGESILLPIYWDGDSDSWYGWGNNVKRIEWSQNGEYALVYGDESNNKYCPIGKNMVTGKQYKSPCWFLIDAQSGEIEWWLKREIIEERLSWEGLDTDYEAAISPDNKWIAMSVMYTPIRYSFIVSIESDQFVEIGNFVATKIQWVDN